jgi:hypothetical protein
MIFLVPVLYLAVFTVLLGIVWSRLNDKSVIAITSVLAGGLAGLIGAFLSSVISHRRSEQESEDRLKQYASTQALELTKLEFELRREAKQQNQLLAPAKVYREFYKALFELYKTRSWPKDIEELGLLNILEYQDIKRSDTSDKPLNPTSAGGGLQQQ